jgi:uncharacterized sporulation protein YeaH/YhbH (DUF444 family)
VNDKAGGGDENKHGDNYCDSRHKSTEKGSTENDIDKAKASEPQQKGEEADLEECITRLAAKSGTRAYLKSDYRRNGKCYQM